MGLGQNYDRELMKNREFGAASLPGSPMRIRAILPTDDGLFKRIGNLRESGISCGVSRFGPNEPVVLSQSAIE